MPRTSINRYQDLSSAILRPSLKKTMICLETAKTTPSSIGADQDRSAHTRESRRMTGSHAARITSSVTARMFERGLPPVSIKISPDITMTTKTTAHHDQPEYTIRLNIVNPLTHLLLPKQPQQMTKKASLLPLIPLARLRPLLNIESRSLRVLGRGMMCPKICSKTALTRHTPAPEAVKSIRSLYQSINVLATPKANGCLMPTPDQRARKIPRWRWKMS